MTWTFADSWKCENETGYNAGWIFFLFFESCFSYMTYVFTVESIKFSKIIQKQWEFFFIISFATISKEFMQDADEPHINDYILGVVAFVWIILPTWIRTKLKRWSKKQ